MDNVKVHYNSDKPAQLQALAYAQGTDIHIAPGQEKHVPHEAWHMVQQKQGRVQPTVQMKGNPVNDNMELEAEADLMGTKAISPNVNDFAAKSFSEKRSNIQSSPMQLVKGLKEKQKIKITGGEYQGAEGVILEVQENGSVYLIEVNNSQVQLAENLVVVADEANTAEAVQDENPFGGFDFDDDLMGPTTKIAQEPPKKKKTEDEKIEETISSYRDLIDMFESQSAEIKTPEDFGRLFRKARLNGALHIDENKALHSAEGRQSIIYVLKIATQLWAELNAPSANASSASAAASSSVSSSASISPDDGKRSILKKALLAGGCEAAKCSTIAAALGMILSSKMRRASRMNFLVR